MSVAARALAVFALALLGCADGARDPLASDPGVDTECAGDFDTYAPGMSKQALPDDLTVELQQSEPAPPALRNNVWWVRLSDGSGEPLVGAKLQVIPYMPKHQHASPEVVVAELGPGEYELSPIDLIMPGVWEIPIVVTPSGGDRSQTTFRFCIAER